MDNIDGIIATVLLIYSMIDNSQLIQNSND